MASGTSNALMSQTSSGRH